MAERPKTRGEATTKVMLAREGDSKALAELIELLYPTVRSFIHRLTPSSDASVRDDLVQNALEQLCLSLDRFAEQSRFTSYVYGVCFRVVCRWHRHEKVRRFFQWQSRHVDAPTAASEENRHEAKSLAEAVLADLTHEELTAWVLYVHEGLSRTEVAEVIGKSLVTTKRRLSSAARKIAAKREVGHE